MTTTITETHPDFIYTPYGNGFCLACYTGDPRGSDAAADAKARLLAADEGFEGVPLNHAIVCENCGDGAAAVTETETTATVTLRAIFCTEDGEVLESESFEIDFSRAETNDDVRRILNEASDETGALAASAIRILLARAASGSD